MPKWLIVLIFVLCFAGQALSFTTYGKFKNVEYVKNYDGDTITVNIKNVHPLLGEKINIRVAGIDTPELRGKCVEEKNLANQAKAFVWRKMVSAKKIHLLNTRRGKYFRIVADVEIDKQSLADLLLAEGMAVPYEGGTKSKDWCNQIIYDVR